MSLREAAQRTSVVKDTTCVFGRILRDLSDDDREFYDGMIAAGDPWVRIAKVFNDEFKTTGVATRTNDIAVRKHAMGICSCL